MKYLLSSFHLVERSQNNAEEFSVLRATGAVSWRQQPRIPLPSSTPAHNIKSMFAFSIIISMECFLEFHKVMISLLTKQQFRIRRTLIKTRPLKTLLKCLIHLLFKNVLLKFIYLLFCVFFHDAFVVISFYLFD